MEDIKRRFANEIAAKLAEAAESDAKQEMIEELAENLAGRYEDMTAGGMVPEEAFSKAMEELGSVEELLAYLAAQEPEGGAAERESPRNDVDELFQTLGDMGRTVGDMAKEAAGAAGDFFRSDSFRAAVNEGKRAAQEALDASKRAVREAKEQLKNMAGSGWDGATVHIHVDDDGVSGKARDFGWSNAGDDEERSVPSQGVLGLDVETTGDVDICLDDDPEATVRVEGDMTRLNVLLTEDGVLQVRPVFTASSQFFTFRGASSQDVSLTIPARRWESIRVATGSGDVDMGDDLEVGQLTVQTASGDVECRVKSCERAEFKTGSGDVTLEGNAAQIQAETASGDVYLVGPLGQVQVNTASGDVELSGSVWKARVKSMSGDVWVKSMTLPAEMDLSSKSGDVEVRVPDNGPFKVNASSVSGTVDLRPFAQWSWSGSADPGAPVPRYCLSSISGDVSLDKY